jgi:hypothetical protein
MGKRLWIKMGAIGSWKQIGGGGGVKVPIRTNNKIGPFFSTHKSVRQDDPFSSLFLVWLLMV